MPKFNIVVIGGSGFIGTTLTLTLVRAGHRVAVLSRTGNSLNLIPEGVEVIRTDVSKPGSWQTDISRYDVVINLTGASIFRRWNSRGKQEILESRLLTTSNIAGAIVKKPGNIRQFISVSGVGYYGFQGDEILTEDNPAGLDFIARVAKQWEDAALPVTESGVRLVICRFGHVLGKRGGALPELVKLAKFQLGSRWGTGNQWISWIHERDLAQAVLFLLDMPEICGPVNLVSPNPVRNRELMQILTQKLGARVFIPPVPGFALKILLGQFSSVFLNGQKVAPAVLQKTGFVFNYPDLNVALTDLIGNSS